MRDGDARGSPGERAKKCRRSAAGGGRAEWRPVVRTQAAERHPAERRPVRGAVEAATESGGKWDEMEWERLVVMKPGSADAGLGGLGAVCGMRRREAGERRGGGREAGAGGGGTEDQQEIWVAEERRGGMSGREWPPDARCAAPFVRGGERAGYEKGSAPGARPLRFPGLTGSYSAGVVCLFHFWGRPLPQVDSLASPCTHRLQARGCTLAYCSRFYGCLMSCDLRLLSRLLCIVKFGNV